MITEVAHNYNFITEEPLSQRAIGKGNYSSYWEG